MKNIRKIVSIMLTLVMLMSMTVSVFAVDITINGGASGATYKAYKLLNATENETDATKIAYTLNDKYTSILQEVTGKTTQADIIAYIQDFDDNADGMRAFADAVYAKIVAGGIADDGTTTTNSITGLAQGYYLVAETATAGGTDTYSLVMVDTAGKSGVTVNTKEDYPEVEKKISEDGTTKDYTDAAIGDTISFVITGDISDKYADYDSYYYSFGDTMNAGLTLNQDSIKVYAVNGADKVDVTTSFNITKDASSFTAASNLKEITAATISSTTKIVVEYTADLNENAVKGTTGNTNTVVLEYENNPYNEADGDNNPTTPNEPTDPGESTPDTNVVFTFDTIVNKVDGNDQPLAGAGFTLYKEDSTVDGGWKEVKVLPADTTTTTFSFEGLDAGTYKLVETTVPDGYNKAADVIFQIVPEYDGNGALTALKVKNEDGTSDLSTFTITLDADSSEVSTDIQNNAGTELPSTGGIGTTIFYVAGSILVIGAAILLITKRRMNVQ